MRKEYDESLKKILVSAEQEMLSLMHPYVGSEHLLLAILKKKNKLTEILKRNGLTYSNFKSELIHVIGKGSKKSSHILYTPMLRKIIDVAIKKAKEKDVNYNHLFKAILDEGEGIAIRLMINMNLDLDFIYNESSDLKENEKLLLYEVGTILNEKISKDEKVIGREIIINDVIEILLRKNKNNPLLLGDAGVGKTAIIEELTRRIEKNTVPTFLKNKKIVLLEMSFLVAGTKYRGEFEERLTKIIEEVINNKDIILFIDEIHTIVGAGGAEGAIDASNILKPYLARGELKCIGATTTKEYEKYIAKDKALERRFQPIFVKEPTKEETENILKTIKKEYERHHNLKISNQNINDIIELSNVYILNRKNPDKAIDILDSVCAKSKLKTGRITKNDILRVVSLKSNVPLCAEFNNKKLGKELLTIIDNKKEIKEIVNLINKNNYLQPLSFSLDNNIINKFAFILGDYLNHKTIEIDLLEFSDYDGSMSKLLGTSQGYVGYDDDYLLSSFKNNISQILIVKNYNLSSKKLANLIDKILKDGSIDDNKGNKLYFTSSIILLGGYQKDTNTIGFENTKKMPATIKNKVTKAISKNKNQICN